MLEGTYQERVRKPPLLHHNVVPQRWREWGVLTSCQGIGGSLLKKTASSGRGGGFQSSVRG